MQKYCGGIAKGRKKVCGFVWIVEKSEKGRMKGMQKDCGGIAKGRKKVCGFVWLM